MQRERRTQRPGSIVWLWISLAALALIVVGVSRAVVAGASAPEEDFIPTQQLGAGAAVAFPVDI